MSLKPVAASAKGAAAGPAPGGRTIVISDVHGHPDFITNALAHAAYHPEVDQVIFAGDFMDRGPYAEGCLRLLEQHGARMLLGNHELAVLLGFRLVEQTRESRSLRQTLLERVLSGGADAWRVATVVDGVVISHAGVSSAYQDLWQEVESDPEQLAERLNELFLQAVRHELETGGWDERGILGDQGPLWFRPYPWSNARPLAGLTQVVGHTPPLEELEEKGFFMVDPCAHMGSRTRGRYRYAVIQDGRVRVESGRLGERSAKTACVA